MKGNIMNVTLENYSRSEAAWLCEMIAEKLAEMGHDDVGSFSYSIEVEFEPAEEEEDA